MSDRPAIDPKAGDAAPFIQVENVAKSYASRSGESINAIEQMTTSKQFARNGNWRASPRVSATAENPAAGGIGASEN